MQDAIFMKEEWIKLVFLRTHYFNPLLCKMKAYCGGPEFNTDRSAIMPKVFDWCLK